MSEEKLVPNFIERIARRNRPSYVIFRVCLGYTVIFIASFALGSLFFSQFATDLLNSAYIASGVESHFFKVFDGCSSFRDYFMVIITASAPDLRILLLLFASGFTYFSGLVTSAFTLCRAFTVGFALRYLLLVENMSFNSQSVAFVFALFELTFAGLMIFLCAKSQIFSYDFRRIRGRKSRILSSPVIYMYMLLYLTAFGLVLVLNACSCITLMILY